MATISTKKALLTIVRQNLLRPDFPIQANFLILDAGIGCAVENQTRTFPPGSPTAGDAYRIATAGAFGAWTDREGQIAMWTGSLAADGGGTWIYILAWPGFIFLDKTDLTKLHAFTTQVVMGDTGMGSPAVPGTTKSWTIA